MEDCGTLPSRHGMGTVLMNSSDYDCLHKTYTRVNSEKAEMSMSSLPSLGLLGN